jgi:hypothetical protein
MVTGRQEALKASLGERFPLQPFADFTRDPLAAGWSARLRRR